mmetsp:Transcript_89358/g.224705  ORF Transcript_89358/g.224705 Transcript_89358/m.224705 type:complete len:168 (-) Transcript_89358:323-826(-)
MAGAQNLLGRCLRWCWLAFVVHAPSAAVAAESASGMLAEGACGQDTYSLIALRSAPAWNQSVAATRGSACVGQTGWDTLFNDHLYHCGLRTGFAMPAVGKCLAKRQGVSRACGDCMGKLVVCGFPCASACCSGTCRFSDRCWECNDKKCNPEFAECAGVYPPHPTTN